VSRGMSERERESGHVGPLRNLLNFKIIQICSNWVQCKVSLSELEKFEIKYGWKVFEVSNKFPYRNFSIFKIDFELKFREAFMS
jgi:hypothetical protein